ncbi:hypothetical protein Tco_1547546 [Tanacetum coccineum]
MPTPLELQGALMGALLDLPDGLRSGVWNVDRGRDNTTDLDLGVLSVTITSTVLVLQDATMELSRWDVRYDRTTKIGRVIGYENAKAPNKRRKKIVRFLLRDGSLMFRGDGSSSNKHGTPIGIICVLKLKRWFAGYTPTRQVELRIDLAYLVATPVAREPFRLAPSDMKELAAANYKKLTKPLPTPRIDDPISTAAKGDEYLFKDRSEVGEVSQLRVPRRSNPQDAFRTPIRSYEFLVMLLVLTKATSRDVHGSYEPGLCG